MDKLPNEIKEIIFKYTISKNKYYTTKEINCKKRDLALIYLTFKEKKDNYEKYCEINNYINIYNKYQYDYDNYINYKLLKKQKINEFSPILIDLFNTEIYLPCTYSSKKKFIEKLFYNDIKKIIKLIPNCVYSTFGQMRCRTQVTPLCLALSNENVPIYMIELLLNNNGGKNLDIYVDNYKCNILDDYFFCNHKELQNSNNSYKFIRYNKIKDLINNLQL
tara:strand:- start:11298 stop:11957 length:660 start_codon:yes stop_codon:yes gene_type:complete